MVVISIFFNITYTEKKRRINFLGRNYILYFGENVKILIKKNQISTICEKIMDHQVPCIGVCVKWTRTVNL